MNRLQYNILLEEAGIYSKRRLTKNEAYEPESNLVYEEEGRNERYEILPSDLSTEEIKVALLAMQTNEIKAIRSSVFWIALIVIIVFLMAAFVFITALF